MMPFDTGDSEDIVRVLRRMNLVAADAAPVLTPLTGGVASDIWKVESDDRKFVVKRALSKLRVAADWQVPTSRNASEADWLRVAHDIAPKAVPHVIGQDIESGLFAMTYMPTDQYPVWKAELHAGRVDIEFAAAVGRTIATIHSRTAGSEQIARQFANDAIFHAIRLEPYLEATASRHPDIADRLVALSRATLARRIALVHGDLSPKNILAGPDGPVFIDAECAWYGDPAFDLAFCLNHLLLKCVWTPQASAGFLAAFDALQTAYLREMRHEAPEALEQRTAALLPALFLARVDGKSPAEYVTSEADQQKIRSVAIPLIQKAPTHLRTIRDAWARALEDNH